MTTYNNTLKVRLNGRSYNVRREDGAEIVNTALEYLASNCVRETDPLITPSDTLSYLRLKIGDRQSEVFAVLFLDNKHRLIEFREMFFGTIDGASVHAREVVKAALETNAAAVIFSHNHPSGYVDPSQSDIQITSKLKAALALIDVRVLDHFVVSQTGSTSMAERGLM